MCIYTYLDIKVVLLSLCCPKHLIQWLSYRWLLNLFFVIHLFVGQGLPMETRLAPNSSSPMSASKYWRYRWAPSCLDNFLSKTNPQPPNFCFLKLPNLGSPSSIMKLLSVHPQCSMSCSNLSSWSPLLHQSYLPRKKLTTAQVTTPGGRTSSHRRR